MMMGVKFNIRIINKFIIAEILLTIMLYLLYFLPVNFLPDFFKTPMVNLAYLLMLGIIFILNIIILIGAWKVASTNKLVIGTILMIITIPLGVMLIFFFLFSSTLYGP